MIPDDHGPLFAATISALVRVGYIEPSGTLGRVLADDAGRVFHLPGEVLITGRAHKILDD